MAGTAHPWIFRSSLARASQLTLLVVALGLATVSWPHPGLPASLALALNPPVPAVTADAAPSGEWPRAALRLWFLLPQILPRP
ncbi:hypothetical protein Verru16b_03283 [Lacunisphaera limnophila]|uniref:Uncharacterized protein n=1 Tax=Lacunisphaera limnophila TaxID=1838286 RepID=A0A1D8AZ63_9BACT|nr:hypothetical protein [Lacunisphaera limnophila]AOS46186.1 hypothetical protein Verru16b_03283 [Lacunisphaera limnophila]